MAPEDSDVLANVQNGVCAIPSLIFVVDGDVMMEIQDYNAAAVENTALLRRVSGNAWQLKVNTWLESVSIPMKAKVNSINTQRQEGGGEEKPQPWVDYTVQFDLL